MIRRLEEERVRQDPQGWATGAPLALEAKLRLSVLVMLAFIRNWIRALRVLLSGVKTAGLRAPSFLTVYI